MSIVGVILVAFITLSLSSLYTLRWFGNIMGLIKLDNEMRVLQDKRISILAAKIRVLEVNNDRRRNS